MTNSLVSDRENVLLDKIELGMLNADGVDLKEFPLQHSFIPGFYIRSVFLPAGCKLTSKIHKTTHSFHISKGVLLIYSDGKVNLIAAPYTGITKPGTRRYLDIIEDTIFSTFHPFPELTGEENNYTESEKSEIIEEMEKLLIEQRVNPLIGISYKEIKEQAKLTNNAH